MKRAGTLIVFFCMFLIGSTVCTDNAEEWITILVHGAIGFGANLKGRTISQIKRDAIEGSVYERNVLKIRKHPYLFALQPIGKYGLHLIPKNDCLNAASIFSELYTAMAERFECKESNTFYTFGWSGLISEKRRQCAARKFYCLLKELIAAKKKLHPNLKIRLIGYSHGATMFLKFAKLREKEFCKDTFMIDQTVMLGLPVNKEVTKAVTCPPFKKIYHIYSKGDKIQRLDIFTSTYVFSERTFKGLDADNLTQIELRITAPLRRMPNKVLPANMRGMINQAPGHVEFWSFGWTESMYRKNLNIFPLNGATFIPYLIHAAHKLPEEHIKVDLRPTQEKAIVESLCGGNELCIPFMSQADYTAFLEKALAYHPCYSACKEEFLRLEASVDVKAYK